MRESEGALLPWHSPWGASGKPRGGSQTTPQKCSKEMDCCNSAAYQIRNNLRI